VKCRHESPLVRALVFAASVACSTAAADDGELHRITASVNSYFFCSMMGPWNEFYQRNAHQIYHNVCQRTVGKEGGRITGNPAILPLL
jgi:hypothetical protein